MKTRFIIFSIILLAAVNLRAAEKLPEPAGFVNDFANILVNEDKARLEALFSELEEKTTAEGAVVTVKSTEPLNIETYAVNLFERWKIGKKGKDNGILLLVALKDRKVRIEVGYGLEGAVPDALAVRIVTNVIIPYFKKGNYSGGIVAGSSAIVQLIAKEYNVAVSTLKDFPVASSSRSRTSLPRMFSLLFFIMIFGLLRGMLWWAILTPGTRRRRGGFWYGSGFGGSSGGFSGGFGGFGGGFSGGGGASGGW